MTGEYRALTRCAAVKVRVASMDSFESLNDQPISRLGELPNFSVTPQETVLDALRLMQKERHGAILVCEGRKLIGVLTERDILRRMGASLPLDVPVSEVLSGSVWSVSQTDSVATALRAMNQHQCRHLAVTGREGEAVGFLSVRRIVHELVELFPAAVYNLPPDSTKAPTSAEGA